MKLRSGFVSNSSTSSFVAVGFDVDPAARAENVADLRKFLGLPVVEDPNDAENGDDLYYAKRDNGVWYMTSRESGSPKEGQHVICVILTEDHGYDLDVSEVHVNELASGKLWPLRVAFGVDESMVKLYTGTRSGYL